MKFRVKPTRVQVLMIALMVIALTSLLAWVVPELIGVFSPTAEDTYSEWVFDLPLWAVLTIVGVQVVVGLAAIGSSWHFLEGWGRRRRLERERKGPELPPSLLTGSFYSTQWNKETDHNEEVLTERKTVVLDLVEKKGDYEGPNAQMLREMFTRRSMGEGDVPYTLLIPGSDWQDFGKPLKITLQIRPEDLLNPGHKPVLPDEEGEWCLTCGEHRTQHHE